MPYVSTVQDSLPQRLLANKQNYQSYTGTILISQLHLQYVNPNGNFNPRGVQVFCMFSMMASHVYDMTGFMEMECNSIILL